MLILKQMVANPIKNYPNKDLAQQFEQPHPTAAVAVLAITLPFPERDNMPLFQSVEIKPVFLAEHRTACNDMSTAFPPAMRSSAWMPQIPGAHPLSTGSPQPVFPQTKVVHS